MGKFSVGQENDNVASIWRKSFISVLVEISLARLNSGNVRLITLHIFVGCNYSPCLNWNISLTKLPLEFHSHWNKYLHKHKSATKYISKRGQAITLRAQLGKIICNKYSIFLDHFLWYSCDTDCLSHYVVTFLKVLRRHRDFWKCVVQTINAF